MPESKYEYIKKVGGGATCETFLVRHKDMNEYRILKKLPISQQNKKSFDVEVEILKNIKGKGIPILYDITVSKEYLLIVEEFIEGKSLKHLLIENDIDIHSAIQCIIDVCNILYTLHQHNYVYLDMKPEHIILSQENSYLIDYGNCMAIGSDNVAMISEKFAAPEQFHGEPVGIYSDIYSIGVLLIEVSAHCPNSGNICGPLKEIIETCMSPLPEERFSDMKSLITNLELCMEQMSYSSSVVFPKKNIPNCRLSDTAIYIYGIRNHVGCTHLSLALANYFSKTYGISEYISESRQDSFIAMMNNGILKCGKNGDFFYDNIRVKNNQWKFIHEQEVSKIRIIDRGCIMDKPQRIHPIDKSAGNILVISDAAYWNDKNLLYHKLNEVSGQWGEKIIIVANFIDKTESKKIGKYIGKTLIRMPLFDNPMDLDGEIRHFIKQIVKRIDSIRMEPVNKDT